jgi:hypothetical protein
MKTILPLFSSQRLPDTSTILQRASTSQSVEQKEE